MCITSSFWMQILILHISVFSCDSNFGLNRKGYFPSVKNISIGPLSNFKPAPWKYKRKIEEKTCTAFKIWLVSDPVLHVLTLDSCKQFKILGRREVGLKYWKIGITQESRSIRPFLLGSSLRLRAPKSSSFLISVISAARNFFCLTDDLNLLL